MSAPYTVLVVEDNLDAQYLTCELLAALGHAAQGASDGEQALAMLATQAFEVLLTDVNLPGISGIELATQAVQTHPAMKIIFASGYGGDVASHVGFASLSLPKPYDMAQLQTVLDAL